jgi:tRNA pseudouridine55 synthase
VGHAGTLDPKATGVMILCTGGATKRIPEFQSHTKEYLATLKLGATTPSYDLETLIDRTYPTSHITLASISEVLTKFTGNISQIPPVYSACKINGKRSYDLARMGEAVELAPKTLKIEEIELIDYTDLILRLRIVCTKGTYIRALARDIGEALGSGAYLIGLERTRIGDITLDRCIKPEEMDEYIEEGKQKFKKKINETIKIQI